MRKFLYVVPNWSRICVRFGLRNLNIDAGRAELGAGLAGLGVNYGGWAFDLVDFGWFQAARGGCDRYSGRFDINVTLACLAAVRFDTIATLFWIPLVSLRFQ